MTYTFKLSRRLARLRAAAAVISTGTLLTLACTSDPTTGPGSLSSPDQTRVSVAPTPGSTLQSASTVLGGSKGGKGRGRGQRTVVDLAIAPDTIAVGEGMAASFTATALLSDGSVSALSVIWAATGGTIDAKGKYTAGSTPGNFAVSATAGNGLADTAAVIITESLPVVTGISLSPTSASLLVGASKQFIAVGKSNNGTMIAVSPRYAATGGTISADGVYQAGQTPGTFKVVAADSVTGLADTSAVVIEAPPPSLQAVVISPATVSVTSGMSQQFTASGKMSDGTTSVVTVVWRASGGSISSAGLYIAGQTGGTFQVIATQSGGTLADTAIVTVVAPPPVSSAPPPGGQTFFSADAESGTLSPPWVSWGIYTGGGGLVPVNSTAIVKNGSRSWKFENTNPSVSPLSTSALAVATPQTSMGAPGRFGTGYYSYWLYIDAGYDLATWNVLSNFFAMTPTPEPIGHVGLSIRNGVRQLYVDLKRVEQGEDVGAEISTYVRSGGNYFMTATSPAGIKAFPKNQWVHICIYYKFARTDGQITIWQDGVKIMDLTAPTFNTRDGTGVLNPETNNDMMVSVGMYHGPVAEAVRRIYVDDYKVTDYRPVP